MVSRSHQSDRVSRPRWAQDPGAEPASTAPQLYAKAEERVASLRMAVRASFLRVHWVAVPKAVRARRVNISSKERIMIGTGTDAVAVLPLRFVAFHCGVLS
jgi:hypothetical protein